MDKRDKYAALLVEYKAIRQSLISLFPCPECQGTGGVEFMAGGWNPCIACYGEGHALPSEREAFV